MRNSFRLVLAVPLLVLVLGYFLLGIPETGLFSVTYEPPSPEVEALAIATTMTPEAEQLFYKQSPQIAPKETFHSLCRKVKRNVEKTVLLGCFTSDGYQGNIVIQQVMDERLEGTMEVVAAHELLHAAYQKLNRRERKDLGLRLESAAAGIKDSFLAPVIEEYKKGDRDIYRNELHSYLGTELEELGDPELERYYQRYFSNRQAVIAFSKQSRRTLVALESQANELMPEIDRLEAILKQEERALKLASDDLDYWAQTLDRMRSDLVSLRRSAEDYLRGGSSSLVSQFEQAQTQFNAEVRAYNAQIASHRARVDQFNQDYEVYKQKIQTYNELNQNKRDILDTLKFDGGPMNINVSPVESE